MERVTRIYLQALRQRIETDEKLEIVNEFYIAFSRFEFVLKELGYMQNTNSQEAKPDWNSYSDSIKDGFDHYANTLGKTDDLRIAIDYILTNPPKKQYKDLNNKLIFKPAIDHSRSITKRLSLYIRRIRNNLFHGAKLMQVNNANSREFLLIKSALLVISSWIERDERFRAVFLYL